jgi:hypothetical protein
MVDAIVVQVVQLMTDHIGAPFCLAHTGSTRHTTEGAP